MRLNCFDRTCVMQTVMYLYLFNASDRLLEKLHSYFEAISTWNFNFLPNFHFSVIFLILLKGVIIIPFFRKMDTFDRTQTRLAI